MTVRLLTWDGRSYELPVTLSWRILRTGSVPCDELEATCLYDGKLPEVLPQANRFAAYEGEQAVLIGVVDDYAVSAGEEGLLLHVSGRGMAALLLDNEAEAAVYQRATLEEILRCHVAPYGINCRRTEHPVGTAAYQVRSGSSQWNAVSAFTRLAGGFTPYMTALGELVAAPMAGSGQTFAVEGGEVLSCTLREKRYGVLSEVLVKDKTTGLSRRVVNEAFANRGGCRRQVLYMPGRSTSESMRYTGEYQIQQSQAGTRQVELRLPGAFRSEPGDVIQLTYPPLELQGTYDVVEAESAGDTSGTVTTVVMEERK